MQRRRFPDFFIVGAPRCGTTALYHYLRTHLQLYLPRIKEPNYFASDVLNRRFLISWNDYLKLFSPALDNQLCGEASTYYLCSTVAIPTILQINPRAKVIAMVRDPVEMFLSIMLN